MQISAQKRIAQCFLLLCMAFGTSVPSSTFAGEISQQLAKTTIGPAGEPRRAPYLEVPPDPATGAPSKYITYGMVKRGYEKDAAKGKDGKYQVQYFDKYQREAYRLLIENGLFIDPITKQPIKIARNYMYVMDGEGRFYAAEKEEMRIHHSSFLSGAPVACAGMLTIVDGVLTSISSYSGHYMTSKKMFRQVKAELTNKGVSYDKKDADRGGFFQKIGTGFFRFVNKIGVKRYSYTREEFPNRHAIKATKKAA